MGRAEAEDAVVRRRDADGPPSVRAWTKEAGERDEGEVSKEAQNAMSAASGGVTEGNRRYIGA